MADHVWTVLCKDFVIDSTSQNVTIFQTLEQIALVRDAEVADQLPDKIQMDFVLLTLWTRSQRDVPESFKMRYVFKGADGKEIGSQEFSIDLTKYVRHRVFARLQGISFVGFGRYTFVVQKQSESGRWVKVAVVPLEVELGNSGETIQ